MPKTKINIYHVKNQLDRIESFLIESAPKNFYDPLIHIQTEDKGERVYKFNGVYYRDAANLFVAVTNQTNYPNKISAFRNLLADYSRIEELWSYGIQPEYIQFVPQWDIYVCTDGEFLHKNLTPYKHQLNNSMVRITIDGKPDKKNRALVMFQLFVDPTVSGIHFRSSNYSDCRIDNVKYEDED